MKRRELIKLVTLSTGAVLSAPLLGSLFTSCKEAPKIADSDYVLQFFNAEDFELLKTLIDIILPKTESPSATEVGVHKMIDTMVGTVYKPADRKKYMQNFTALKEAVNPDSGNQLETLQNLLASDKKAKNGLLELKQQTIAYYLSTEEIGKNYLNHLPVPGNYEPCISLEEAGGKLWTE